jgi:hypothetical protein
MVTILPPDATKKGRSEKEGAAFIRVWPRAPGHVLFMSSLRLQLGPEISAAHFEFCFLPHCTGRHPFSSSYPHLYVVLLPKLIAACLAVGVITLDGLSERQI